MALGVFIFKPKFILKKTQSHAPTYPEYKTSVTFK